MKYHIYFHNDPDGVASSAVLLNFLTNHGDSIVSFNPIDYTPGLKENWPTFKFKEPFILVDFLYHPRASWWFDHHPTSFIKEEWRKSFVNDDTHFFDIGYKSCCSAVLAHLKNRYKYEAQRHIKQLAVGTDIIDGAGYVSAKEALLSTKPIIRLARLLGEERSLDKKAAVFYKFIIKKLAVVPIMEVIKMPRFAHKIRKIEDRTRKALKMFDEFSELRGKVVFIDLDGVDTPLSSFSAYYLYPKLPYSAVVHGNGTFHISVGKNPWAKFPKKDEIHLGGLLSKYGGGGHDGIGATETKTKKEILKIADEVIEYLNKSG